MTRSAHKTWWHRWWTHPHDYRWGRYQVPNLAIRDAALHLGIALGPALLFAWASKPWVAMGWTMGGMGLFALRNLAVAWEVKQGWHDPVFGPLRRARLQEEHERFARPLATVLTVVLVVAVGVMMLGERQGWLHLPKRHVPGGVTPLPSSAAYSPQPPRAWAVHQRWRDVLHAAARDR